MREISSGRIPSLLPPKEIEPEYVYTAATDNFHLRDYWGILVKRRRLVILVFAAFVAIGAYFSLTATPLYRSTAIIKIEPQNPTVTGVEIYRIEGTGSFGYYETQFQLLQSRSLAARVIADLKLDADKSFTSAFVTSSSAILRIKSWLLNQVGFVVSLMQALKSKKEFNEAPVARVATETARKPMANDDPVVAPGLVGLYKSFLEVKPIKGTQLVEIGFKTPDPRLSSELAEAHARGFISMSRQSRFDLNKEARDFLDEKNEELKKKLERSEDALNRFRQKNGVVSMDRGENIVVERFVALNQQLTGARAQRIEAESLYKVVENKSTQYLSQVLSQGMVPAHRSHLLSLETEKEKLSTIFKPDHPRIIELNQQIGEAKRALNTEINNVVRGIHESYLAARTREQALDAEAQKQQQMALNLKEVGVEFAVLEEEVKVNRSLYENVLKRLSETAVSNDLAISNMQISQHAEKPRFPSEPDVVMNLIMSAGLGLLMGVGLVFFLDYLDSSVNTPENVRQAVGLATFGVVPHLSALDYQLSGYGKLWARRFLPTKLAPSPLDESSVVAKGLILSQHPLSLVTESYRTIRTALLFSQSESPPQVVLFTSPSPSEGKTVTTLNLAIALAQDGYKVLVIDADLRKGTCHVRFGLKNRRGLSNIFTNNLPFQDAIQETSVSGLSILSRGICPLDPSDLLGSSKMREMLATLRELYNFILIDSPPAIAISDAAVLSINCDGVILVFHGQKTTAAAARRAIERLDAVRAPILGVILNGIDLRNPNYAYYRSYYGSDYGKMTDNNNGDGSSKPTMVVVAPTELRSIELGPGTVSKEFFEQMIFKLGEAVGPMASVIVIEQVASLGESLDSFPKSRLKELFEHVCEEILDGSLRQRFETAMVEELRSL